MITAGRGHRDRDRVTNTIRYREDRDCGRSSVRYGTRLGDLKENWFLLFCQLSTQHTLGGPGTPPIWRTREEFCTVRNSAR
jgi:hypothetical protein